jgi:NTE family protein
MKNERPNTVAMVFSGGLGLAAYHAGVYQAFAERDLHVDWVTGSSAGAVTAGLIAGNRVDDRIERLRAFWNYPPRAPSSPASSRHLYGWLGAIQARLTGSLGHFHPRFPSPSIRFHSLYDLTPMKERMARLIDFGRLNSGETTVCVAATDIESGEPVIFDSRKHPIELDHLLASCGFLPEFAPVEIGGRLLGDGGLSLNAPFDPILEADEASDLLLYVIDLFARDGARPDSLEAAAERKNDLLFANQTTIRLKYCLELRKLRRQLESPDRIGGTDQVLLLSYRPGLEEPGPEKSFEFSPQGLAQRWTAGSLDMLHSLEASRSDGITFVRRPQA